MIATPAPSSSIRRPWLARGGAIGLTLGLFALTTARPSTQGERLVLVDVAVETAAGQPATGLTRDDFEIAADGAARPIAAFAAGTQRPLPLVVLFDVTSSMDVIVKRRDLRKAVETALVPRVSPKDRVHVGSFARQTAIGPPIVGNPRALISAVGTALDPRKEDTFGPSPIWDAVDLAVTALANADGRRAVLLITDGQGTGNRQSPEETAAHAVQAGVSVDVMGEDVDIVLRQDGNTGVRVRPGTALQWIAFATGGLYLPDHASPATPGPILDRLLTDLHERYTLGFVPPVNDGKEHTLVVNVKREGLKVRARRSYVAPER